MLVYKETIFRFRKYTFLPKKHESDREEFITTKLFIIDNFKNLVDMDLDESNIKKS